MSDPVSFIAYSIEMIQTQKFVHVVYPNHCDLQKWKIYIPRDISISQ